MRPRTRRSRSFRPDVLGIECLEDRKMMSGVSNAIAISSGPAYIGQHFNMRVLDPNGNPYAPGVISSVYWNIPGAVTSRTLDATGFHDNPMISVKTTGDTVSGYWADTPGNQTVTATIYYANPTWQGLPIPVRTPDIVVSSVNVNPITATMSFYTVGSTKVFPDSESESGWSVGAGVGMSVVVNGGATPPLQGGQFGVIQTVQSTVIDRVTGGYDVGGVNPLTLQPYTMLDNSPEVPGGTTNPYYATHTVMTGKPPVFTTSTSEVLSLGDTPSSYLDDYIDVHARHDAFTDYVVVTPKDGIPVVAGSITWEWGATTMWGPNTYPSIIMAQNPIQTSGGQFGALVPFNKLPKWDFAVEDEPGPFFKPDMPNMTPLMALLPAGWLNQMDYYSTLYHAPSATKRISDGANPYMHA